MEINYIAESAADRLHLQSTFISTAVTATVVTATTAAIITTGI